MITDYTLDLATSFARDGVETLAYTCDASSVDAPFRAAGVPLRHAPLGGFLDIPSAIILARQLRHEPRGTILHTHRYRDAFIALAARKLARRKDIKVIHTRHKIQPAYDTWLLRRVYRNLDAQIFVSQTARDSFLSTWRSEYPFDPRKLHVVFPTLDEDITQPLPFPTRGAVTALYLGPLEPGKGLEILIDALFRLREVRGRICICGTGHPDYVDSLRRRAQARGVMEMIDWKKTSDSPRQLLAECHFGVMPSVAPEPFGYSSLHFLAAGRPMVASNNGAQTEYLRDDENALLVAPANASALGDALLRMAADTDLRLRLAAGAFQTHRTRLRWQRSHRLLSKILFKSSI